MDPMVPESMMVFTGNANPKLAQAVTKYLNIPLGSATVNRFSDGEVMVQLLDNVRGKDVFILQSTCAPTNDNLMELMIMVDALKRASARRITAAIPYYGYARQDRRPRSTRVAISAKVVANMLQAVGVDRVLTMDLHADQIQGFFDIPVDHLAATPVIANYFRAQKFDDVVVVSPDLGGVTRARILADHLQAPIAIIEKRRPKPGCAEVMNLIGDVEGKTAVIIDDIVDTAGSLCEGARALEKRGAKRIFASCSHAILSDPAVQRINESPIEKLVITDTIPLPPEKQSDKFVVLSLADALGDVMMRIQSHRSVSQLFR